MVLADEIAKSGNQQSLVSLGYGKSVSSEFHKIFQVMYWGEIVKGLLTDALVA